MSKLKLKSIDLNAVLCYVEGNIAFFTTQPLAQQWGDDWNDAPYEHNAGYPYGFSTYDAREGKKPWTIYRILFDANLNTPADLADSGNSNYSVQDINGGATAWLVSGPWSEKKIAIKAGATVSEFIRLVHEAGGVAYLPVELQALPAAPTMIAIETKLAVVKALRDAFSDL